MMMRNMELENLATYHAPPAVLFGGYDRRSAGKVVGSIGMLAGLSTFVAAAVKMGLDDEVNTWALAALMVTSMGIMSGSSRLARHGTTTARESAEGFGVGALMGAFITGWAHCGLADNQPGMAPLIVITALFHIFILLGINRCVGGSLDGEPKDQHKANKIGM
ncbi:MAG: hypothetical protein ACHQAX_07780 [Gammaproteobacteria bacterium]